MPIYVNKKPNYYFIKIYCQHVLRPPWRWSHHLTPNDTQHENATTVYNIINNLKTSIKKIKNITKKKINKT